MLLELERLIAEKNAKRMELEADIQALERARDILLRDSKENPRLPFTVAPVSVMKRGRKPSQDSDIALATSILAEFGVPMHLDEIVREMANRGRTVNRLSIGGTLARRAKQGTTFFRTGQPNTFGLLSSAKANGSGDQHVAQ